MHIPTAEQLARLTEIKKVMGDYEHVIAESKMARKSLAVLKKEAREIMRGPVKPRKPRKPKVITDINGNPVVTVGNPPKKGAK